MSAHADFNYYVDLCQQSYNKAELPGQDEHFLFQRKENPQHVTFVCKGSTINKQEFLNNFQWFHNSLLYVLTGVAAFFGIGYDSKLVNQSYVEGYKFIAKTICKNIVKSKDFHDYTSITLCGHSRGGLLAILVAIEPGENKDLLSKLKVISFAAPSFPFTYED